MTLYNFHADVRQVFQALQTAYIRLLRNPFYVPDQHDPRTNKGTGSLQINSPRFIKEVERIGRAWYPGIGAMGCAKCHQSWLLTGLIDATGSAPSMANRSPEPVNSICPAVEQTRSVQEARHAENRRFSIIRFMVQC